MTAGSVDYTVEDIAAASRAVRSHAAPRGDFTPLREQDLTAAGLGQAA
ncbi:hypothetical protein [Streptomyces sp. NPDC015125]